MDKGRATSGQTASSGKRNSAHDTMSLSQQPTPSLPAPIVHRRPIKTALHQAVLDCRLHQVRLLVSKHNANVDCKDLNGRTPMMLACMIEEDFGYRMAKIFLAAGAFLNIRDHMGRTALSYACMNGRTSVVNLILKEDVLDINEADNDGNTPLHHAASSGSPEIVEMLVDCFTKFGLDVDTRNSMGYTSLLLALKKGHFVSAHKLLKKGGASPSLRDHELYLNALEWTQRSQEGQRKYSPRRAPPPFPPASATTLSFSRESTMYQQPFGTSYNHGRRIDNVSWSASTIRLPSIHSSQEFHRSETFVDGKEARQLVIDEIDDFESQNRPVSYRRGGRIPHPSTAKLLALNKRSKTTIIPDMATIFRIYSDQYQPDWMKKPAFSRSVTDIPSASMSQATSESTVIDVAGS